MANFKYFSGTTELTGPHPLRNDRFAHAFPGVRGLRYDGFSKWVGHPVDGPDAILPVDRIIEYKSNPSLHECSAKCMGGNPRGTCECRCGGANHGVGSVFSNAAAFRKAA